MKNTIQLDLRAAAPFGFAASKSLGQALSALLLGRTKMKLDPGHGIRENECVISTALLSGLTLQENSQDTIISLNIRNSLFITEYL